MREGEPVPDATVALEAVLFVADEPVEIADIARALEITVPAARAALARLTDLLGERGLRVQQTGTRVQLVTTPEVGPVIERFLGGRGDGKLSNAALETLAIVAYKQPVTRAAIEAIRGVDCGRALQTLRVRELVQESGRAATLGRPVLYTTTMRFLEHFGLERPDDLPPLVSVND